MGENVEQVARIICKINDAANTIRELQNKNASLETEAAALREAVRVLGAEMGRTQEYVRNLRNGYDDLHKTVGKVSCRHPSDALTQLLKSWPDWKKVNPIASAAVNNKPKDSK